MSHKHREEIIRWTRLSELVGWSKIEESKREWKH